MAPKCVRISGRSWLLHAALSIEGFLSPGYRTECGQGKTTTTFAVPVLLHPSLPYLDSQARLTHTAIFRIHGSAFANSVFTCRTEPQASRCKPIGAMASGQRLLPGSGSFLQGNCKTRAISCKAVRPLSLCSFGGYTESFLLGNSVRERVDVRNFHEA